MSAELFNQFVGNTKYHFIHGDFGINKYTVAYLMYNTGLQLAVSICHPKDRFRKDLGREIAIKHGKDDKCAIHLSNTFLTEYFIQEYNMFTQQLFFETSLHWLYIKPNVRCDIIQSVVEAYFTRLKAKIPPFEVNYSEFRAKYRKVWGIKS